MNVLLLGIFAYILVQLLVGVLVSRRIKSEADYLLAGRSLGLGLGVFTIFATWFGAETNIGAAGAIYESGLAGGHADPFGYAACLFLMGLVFAVPLWRRKLTTLADLFRLRYSAGVERLAVLLLVPASVMWAAAQTRAFGQVIAASSDFDVTIGISIAAAVVIIYTVYGGLMADVITDFVQGIALIAGLAILFFVVLDLTGGLQPALAAVDPQRLQIFGGPETPALDVIEAWAIPICGSVLAQELVARILATRSPEIARRASLLGGGLYLGIGMIPVFIGLVGVQLLPGLEHPEQLLPRLAQAHLNTFLYIMFAGALVSAILSTVDSALLAAASLVSHNLVVPLRPGMSERAKVGFARAGVIVFGIVAYVLALSAEGVYALVESASAFGSAGVFIVAVFALFTRFGGARAPRAPRSSRAWPSGSWANTCCICPGPTSCPWPRRSPPMSPSRFSMPAPRVRRHPPLLGPESDQRRRAVAEPMLHVLRHGGIMTTYILLSRVSPQAFEDPKDFKKMSETVSAKIKEECPGLAWRQSFATLGRFDVVDVIESNDPKQVEKAAMIIRAYGRATTETLVATPWRDFIAML